MTRDTVDVAILGAGFAGSLMALVLARQGRRVALLEKGTHPRFAVGESSTPLANLVLGSLCERYGLSGLAPLTKYGSWKTHAPDVACGLKRGFSFFRHEAGRGFATRPDHGNELLVAASPSDEVGDTQWFREQVDHRFVREAQAAGVSYWDGVKRTEVTRRRHWLLESHRQDRSVLTLEATVVLDASGAGSVLPRALEIPAHPAGLLTSTTSVFSHFRGMRRWSELLTEAGGSVDDHPFDCDDAALHHVMDEGWVWVLRFDNGITSVGLVLKDRDEGPAAAGANDPKCVWANILARYPSIARQMAEARPLREFTGTGRLQRRTAEVAGDNWALLPHTAYFVDPLLSSGNAHTIAGIERLAEIFESHWNRPSFATALRGYGTVVQREIDFVDPIVHGCYAAWSSFRLLTAYQMYYYAGAICAEERRRGRDIADRDEFLYSDHQPFRDVVTRGYDAVRALASNGPPSSAELDAFEARVAADIAPYNVAGLCDATKQNMYPYVESTI